MFLFKKILTHFLLPPGIFILFLLLFGGWCLFKKRWKIGIINLVIGCLMWLLSITPISDPMLRGLESNIHFTRNPKGDVIVLLGGGVYDKAPDLSGVGVPYQSVQAGIVTAVRLQKRLNVPIIVSGGKVYEHMSAAEAPIINPAIK